MQRAKLFAYVNNNIYDIKRILQDKQFHLQLRSEQKEIIQNVLERKDSMTVLPTGFGKSMCYSIGRFMRLELLISHTGILMTFYLSIILDLQNFFH
jgi:superfamily II DNA helicase RecQ